MTELCHRSVVSYPWDTDGQFTHRIRVNCNLTGKPCPAYVVMGGEKTARTNGSFGRELMLARLREGGMATAETDEMENIFRLGYDSIVANSPPELSRKRNIFTDQFSANFFRHLIAGLQDKLRSTEQCDELPTIKRNK